jgi:hypothetical protein
MEADRLMLLNGPREPLRQEEVLRGTVEARCGASVPRPCEHPGLWVLEPPNATDRYTLGL